MDLGPDDYCPGRSAYTDTAPGRIDLHRRDTSYATISDMPLAQITAYKQRKGWTVPFYSSRGTTFSDDCGAGRGFGLSVFLRDGDKVYRTHRGAGGTFIDTSDNYAFWVSGSQGGESEELLGRWRRSRGVTDEVVIATKRGARPRAAGTGYTDNAEGLSARVIRESSERSRERLGMERLDLLYAHIEDPAVPLRETVGAFAGLVAEGAVGLLGVGR